MLLICKMKSVSFKGDKVMFDILGHDKVVYDREPESSRDLMKYVKSVEFEGPTEMITIYFHERLVHRCSLDDNQLIRMLITPLFADKGFFIKY
jgi:hypothetical protein